jgi:Glycosyltransferase (GlcNAc)
MSELPRIYVQIPAYRDSELPKTLLDLYAKAAAPERLRTCVIWQRGPDETLPSTVRALPRLDIVEFAAETSQGCNWARAIAQQRWGEEEYTLVIDSHHRFVRGWDEAAIAMHKQLCDRGVAKPLLTAYLPAYDPQREPGARRKRPYRIIPYGRDHGVLTRLASTPIPLWTSLSEPLDADFLSLHFIFAAGQFNDEIRFSPRIYFFGDEVVTGVRAYTSGYDLYHPHRLLGWHCYDRSGRVPHWDDHPGWHHQHEQSLSVMRRFLTGDYTDDILRLGTQRTVADYEAHTLTKLVA